MRPSIGPHPPRVDAFRADVTLDMPAHPPVERPARYAKPSVPNVSVVQMIDMVGPKPCGAVHGAAAPKACCARALLPCGCALQMACWLRIGSIFLARPHGWCAKRASAASASITSPATRLTCRAGSWYVRSRPAGHATRRISSSSAILAALRPMICVRCPQCGATIHLHQRE